MAAWPSKIKLQEVTRIEKKQCIMCSKRRFFLGKKNDSIELWRLDNDRLKIYRVYFCVLYVSLLKSEHFTKDTCKQWMVPSKNYGVRIGFWNCIALFIVGMMGRTCSLHMQMSKSGLYYGVITTGILQNIFRFCLRNAGSDEC